MQWPVAVENTPPATEPASLAELWTGLLEQARARGVPEEGVLLISRLKRRLKAIGERTAAMPTARMALLDALEPPRAAGRWLPELAPLAGAVDALAAAGQPPAVVPHAAFVDLDVVLVLGRRFDLARACAAATACTSGRRWRGVPAVRQQRLYVGDGRVLLSGSGPGVAATLEVIAEILHPGAFRFGHEGRLWQRAG